MPADPAMDDTRPLLLSVLELGGYPDFSWLYRQCGYHVETLQSIRKALAALKRTAPSVVVTEFNYAPTYGARISSVEPLLARLQSHHAGCRVLLFVDPAQRQHLETLAPQYGPLDSLTYPISEQKLQGWLRSG